MRQDKPVVSGPGLPKLTRTLLQIVPLRIRRGCPPTEMEVGIGCALTNSPRMPSPGR